MRPAPDLERDGIGAIAVWQIENALDLPGYTDRSKALLRRALPPLREAVEDRITAILRARGLGDYPLHQPVTAMCPERAPYPLHWRKGSG